MTYDPAEDGRMSYEAAIAAMNGTLVAALVTLAELNVPVEVRELLTLGDRRRGIKPGALHYAIRAAIRQERGGAE